MATPMTDALIARHAAESADADRECQHELAVSQVKELVAHTRRLETDRDELRDVLNVLMAYIDDCELGPVHDGREKADEIAHACGRARDVLHKT
jgi:hypothetical protein